MPTLTSTTCMKDWMPEWTIVPGHVLAESAELTLPPPAPTSDISNERHPPENMHREESESIWAQELVEDLDTAQKALEEYESAGIEGTISYREYRATRLGRDT